MSEWLKETGCKPVGSAYVGSNPTPTIVKPDFESLLDPGERLIWSGSPSQDRLLMRIDYWLIPLGLVLGIVSFAGFFVALKDVTGGTGSWGWVALAAAGLWAAWRMVLGHVIRRRRLALSTIYVLTDERLLRARVRDGVPRNVRAATFAERPRMRVRPEFEGRATIVVGPVVLFNIEGGARVETLIRQQLPADA